MDYKNFTIRVLFSVLFLFIYLVIFFYYSDKIIYLVSFIYFIILIEILLYFQKFKNILIFYLLFSYFFVIIYFNFDYNIYEFTAIILCISCFDSSCYLIGKNFGRNKIFLISPNKTYEGLFGGILISNIIVMISYLIFDHSEIFFNLNLIILNNVVIFFSFFGDLLQSYFKRVNYIKDSSNFIPGHGGFFDRFDSFLLVIIPFAMINFIF